MAGRYSKNHSNYILRKQHQLINDGNIVERDWGTLGERHSIAPGKKTVYTDGSNNFLFTDNSKSGTKKRNKPTPWSQPYTEQDLTPNIDKSVNIIQLPESDDIRDYAYYGSAVELVRATVENIVQWFPGKLWATQDYVWVSNNKCDNGVIKNISWEEVEGKHVLEYVEYSDLTEENKPNIFTIRNPFNIEFAKLKTFEENDNTLRNLPYSWKLYYINGCEIDSYNIWIKPYDECEIDYSVIYDITLTYRKNPKVCNDIEYYYDYGTEDCVIFSDGESDGERHDEEAEIHIYGIKYKNTVIWCTDKPNLVLMPKREQIDMYFNNIDGFEKLLLTKKTTPLYNPIIKTPKKYNDLSGRYYFTNTRHKFPSFGYCLLCDGEEFSRYVNNIYDVANILDSEYTDNIWRSMTHESIKNFDWTYSREYEDGDAEDNIAGGTRMQNILRIYGRFFDDIKRYVDNIKIKNKVLINSSIGCPTAELSDKAGLLGWEVYSTKLSDVDNIMLNNDFIEDYITKDISRWGGLIETENGLENALDNQHKWFPTVNINNITQNDVDNLFMKLLTLEGRSIFSAKGTKHAIEMVYALFGFGGDDIEFIERYYSVKPRRSDDIIYFYDKVAKPQFSVEYEDVSTQYSTLADYVNSYPNGLNEESKQYIKINGNFYKLTKKTFKEVCKYLNDNKILKKKTETDYSGIPIQEVKLGGNDYIVPYFNQDVYYDGNVQFETNGGWGKFNEFTTVINGTDNGKDYLETMPYVETVSNCGELLTINVYTIGAKRYYYVMDISDITQYTTQTDLTHVSNYFKLLDPNNPQNINNWANIPINVDREDYEDFCNAVDEFGNPINPLFAGEGMSYEDYEMVQYLDSIVLDNLGNNPHSSLGEYDLGYKYYQYIEQPFYHNINNYGFTNNESLYLLAQQIKFEVTEHYDEYNDDGNKIEKIIFNTDVEGTYYLPSKLLIIKHNNINYYFYEYFKNVMVKYITQVIPSTTILVFA